MQKAALSDPSFVTDLGEEKGRFHARRRGINHCKWLIRSIPVSSRKARMDMAKGKVEKAKMGVIVVRICKARKGGLLGRMKALEQCGMISLVPLLFLPFHVEE